MSVYFCLLCDDQVPWRAEKIQPCPTCHSTADVIAAKRFNNLEHEE